MLWHNWHGSCLLRRMLLILWICTKEETTAWTKPACWSRHTTRRSIEPKPLLLRKRGTSRCCSSLNSVNSGANYRSNIKDPVLRLPLLEAELASRLEESEDSGDDESDDDLKTAITDAITAAEFGVRKSQSRFYEAFSNGNMDAMSDVWSESSQIRCVHPGMASVKGRRAVLESWKRYFSVPVPPSSSSSSSFFTIEPERVQIEICGLIAICSCVEKTQGGGQLEALNIYKRENGSWKMTLHQAGPIMRFG